MSLNKKTRLYYVMIMDDFFKSHPFDIIRGMKNGRETILLYLELLTESIHHNGELRFSDNLAFSDDLLSGKFGTPVEIISSSMASLKKMELIAVKDDGTIVINNFEKYIGSRTRETLDKNEEKAMLRNVGGTKNSSLLPKKDEKFVQDSSLHTPKDEFGTNFTTIIKTIDNREENLDNRNKSIDNKSLSGGGTPARPRKEIPDYPETFQGIVKHLESVHISIMDESALLAKFISLKKNGWKDANNRTIRNWQAFFERMAQKQACDCI